MAIPGVKNAKGVRQIDLTSRLDEWRRLLLDISKRSRLISSKFGKGGILAIERPEFFSLWELMAVDHHSAEFPMSANEEKNGAKGTGSSARSSARKSPDSGGRRSLFTNLSGRPLDGRLGRLAVGAQTSLSEQGVNSLFLAFGFLRWFESADSDAAILSPLVLLPVSLSKPSPDSPWELSPIDDDLAPNHPLTELLRSQFRIVLPQFVEDSLLDSGDALKSYFAQVQTAVAEHERWTVELSAGLGTFAFQKISMWQDLRDNQEHIVSHPLCRGLAGDTSQMPSSDTSDILSSDLDETVPPETSYLVRDCDGSQLAAIEMVNRGHHLILDGPPGTGKSQTITNIISRCLAQNKTVLFVSEKAAALEVVKRRLDENQIGDFCLECHSHKSNKRAVVDELGRCLNRRPEVYPPLDAQISELRRNRGKLNEYVRALHLRQSALNLSAFNVHGRLAKLRGSRATRLAIPDPHSIDQEQLAEMEEAILRLADCSGIIASIPTHPWRGCHTDINSLTLPDDIRFHFDRAAQALRKLVEAVRPLETFGIIGRDPSRDDLDKATRVIDEILSFPQAKPQWIALIIKFRALRRSLAQAFHSVRRMLAGGKPDPSRDASPNPAELATYAQLIGLAPDEKARIQLKAVSAQISQILDPEALKSLAFVESIFDRSQKVSDGIILDQSPLAELADWLSSRSRDGNRIGEWIQYSDVSGKLGRLGLKETHDDVIAGRLTVDEALGAMRHRFYQLWLDAAYRQSRLAEFDAGRHEQTLARFCDSDRFLTRNGFVRVRSKLLDESRRVVDSENTPENSELGILLREVHKQRRHLPLRRLFASIPTILLKLKPCVMMSPLSVSTYFGESDIRFDVVIFDEASQVRPHDAIGAAYRGSQLVLAGDQKQLPPTNFFERLGDDEDHEEREDDELEHNSTDYESILDLAATIRMPRQRLKWHYRSKRESLIAFSNRHFYDDELITFPSARDVDGSSGIEFCFVKDGLWSGAGTGRLNKPEAEAIVERVMLHAREHPDKSLGVITMNQSQQMHIMELIDDRRRASPELEPFFAAGKHDPFFVKNLENVQGDERDMIYFGVGYAKNEAGSLSHNFGPLNIKGGERRLNVAVTRAREALCLFTSIRAGDIDLGRTQARGAKLLRVYLDFAERGRAALVRTETEDGQRDFDSDFEAEVARALAEEGLEVRRQIGCSGFRIDLAIVHRDRPGKYILGIECDGATYHSSATARDRDRLRQDILESLGWRICRIWSTDWMRDPRRQIQKVMDEYKRALSADDSPPPPPRETKTLKPISAGESIRPPDAKAAPRYASIDDVPEEVLAQLLIDALKSNGSMPLDDLSHAGARQLGFQRTGPRIRDRIAQAVSELEESKRLAVDANGRIRLIP